MTSRRDDDDGNSPGQAIQPYRLAQVTGLRYGSEAKGAEKRIGKSWGSPSRAVSQVQRAQRLGRVAHGQGQDREGQRPRVAEGSAPGGRAFGRGVRASSPKTARAGHQKRTSGPVTTDTDR
jgi:hypothetical protein